MVSDQGGGLVDCLRFGVYGRDVRFVLIQLRTGGVSAVSAAITTQSTVADLRVLVLVVW